MFLSHATTFLGGMIFAMMFLHGWVLDSVVQPSPLAEDHFHLGSAHKIHSQRVDEQHEEHHEVHGLAGLDCSAHDGPNDVTVTQELVYWRDLPLDNEYISPMKITTDRQYLTFEPDGGEWL